MNKSIRGAGTYAMQSTYLGFTRMKSRATSLCSWLVYMDAFGRNKFYFRTTRYCSCLTKLYLAYEPFLVDDTGLVLATPSFERYWRDSILMMHCKMWLSLYSERARMPGRPLRLWTISPQNISGQSLEETVYEVFWWVLTMRSEYIPSLSWMAPSTSFRWEW